MIAGNYSLEELSKLEVQEAVSFQPRIIVNGKGLIKNAAEGWGSLQERPWASVPTGRCCLS